MRQPQWESGAAESRPDLPEARDFIGKDTEGDRHDRDREHEDGCESKTDWEPVVDRHTHSRRRFPLVRLTRLSRANPASRRMSRSRCGRDDASHHTFDRRFNVGCSQIGRRSERQEYVDHPGREEMAAIGERSAKWRTAESASLERRPQAELFKYQLLDGDGAAVGRAAYDVEVRAGDVVADYHGNWLRVLECTPIDDEDSVYDGALKVEPA